MKQLEKINNEYYVTIEKQREMIFLDENDLINYIINNTVDKLIIKKKCYNKMEEQIEILKICSKLNLEVIVEFSDCQDEYIKNDIIEQMKKYNIKGVIFSFEYSDQNNSEYLLAQKGRMNDLVKSILNIGLSFKEIGIRIKPNDLNYNQIEDLFLMSDSIGVSEINIHINSAAISDCNKDKLLSIIAGNNSYTGLIYIDGENLSDSNYIVKTN